MLRQGVFQETLTCHNANTIELILFCRSVTSMGTEFDVRLNIWLHSRRRWVEITVKPELLRVIHYLPILPQEEKFKMMLILGNAE